MLINLSNHSSTNWSEKQMLDTSSIYGNVIDLPFPHINPACTDKEFEELLDEFEIKIIDLKPTAVHLMGELVFTYKMVNRLKNIGITCIASTTARNTIEKNGVKTSVFEFVQFRNY